MIQEKAIIVEYHMFYITQYTITSACSLSKYKMAHVPWSPPPPVFPGIPLFLRLQFVLSQILMLGDYFRGIPHKFLRKNVETPNGCRKV
jgi:hypothetical protein